MGLRSDCWQAREYLLMKWGDAPHTPLGFRCARPPFRVDGVRLCVSRAGMRRRSHLRRYSVLAAHRAKKSQVALAMSAMSGWL